MKNRDMVIYVLTRGRPEKRHQHTLNNLPYIWLERTIVVCPKEERRFFEKEYGGHKLLDIVTPKVPHVTAKRKWIFQNAEADKILMLDDDLRFHIRPDPKNSTKLVLPGFGLGSQNGNDARLVRMFDAIMKKLDTHRHVGISGRFMNNTVKDEWRYTAKALHALAWHVPTVLKHCKLDRVMCGVEHDLTLQLFEAGFPNAVYYWGTQEEPAGRAAPGGTSLYRTLPMIIESAKKMEKLHPGIVKIAELAPEGKNGIMPPRVRIAWRKALKAK